MIKNTKAKNRSLFSKKLIGILLVSLLFPAFILAQDPEGILLTGLFTDSTDTKEQEILSQGVAETFNVRLVWTYDQTNIITGPLEALAAAKDIPSPTNGLDEPLLSKISGYQQKVIAHSAGTRTIVTLAKEGKVWGDKLYLVSTALISQEELRIIRDLTAEGKGFKEIVVYTGDDMIPDFKELSINFKDYTLKAKITDDLEVSLTKLVYEDRGQEIDVLKRVLNDFVAGAKAQLGKEPLSVTIYGDVAGNKFEIKWEDGTIESFNLQKDTQTGEDFQDEEGIKVIPLYEGFLHGRAQLELLEEFYYKERGRMPVKEDLQLFKELSGESASTAEAIATQARDPNELLVSPEGDVKPGDRLNYTINYENEGEGIAYGVYITDTLEEDLDDSSLIINNSGVYDSKTRTITWFIGELPSKQKGSVSFSVNVKQETFDKSEVINFATVYFPSVPEVTRTNGTVNRVVTYIDNVAPITTATISPPANQAGWNNTDVTVSFSAVDNQDGSGVAKTEYSFDGINWITYTSFFVITDEGTTIVYYKSIDNAGNIESQKTLEIKIDKTLPTITTQISPQPNSFSWNNTDVVITFTATDNLSGVVSVTEPIAITTEGAQQYIGGEATDLAENRATTSVTVNIDKTPPTINISVTPNTLWPPDHKLVDVTIGGEATDILSGISSTTFNVEDEYNTIEPIVSTFGDTLQLESWRNGYDLDGRAYNISVTAKDKANNKNLTSTTVICPHEQGNK